MSYTLLLPMAGLGDRFGGTCKPLLKIDDQTFAEEATAPFLEASPAPTRCVAAILGSHDREYDARRVLLDLLSPLGGEVVVLESATAGPAQTVAAMLDAVSVAGPVVICDCDHALDVQPLVTRLLRGDAEAVVPTWPLDGEDLNAWCVAGVEGDQVVAVAEKRRPDGPHTDEVGVIGCYGFADADDLRSIIRATHAAAISSVLARLIDRGSRVVSVAVGWARFFGDPDRLVVARAMQTSRRGWARD